MMKSVLVVFLGLCASALGMWGVPEQEEGYSVAPKPCCTPAKWEGYMHELTAYYSRRRHRPGLMPLLFHMSYDSKSKKVAVCIGTRRRHHVKLILDFTQKKKYFIYHNSTKCKVSKTTKKFRPACVPKNATYLGTFYQGSGKSKLQQNAWARKGRRFFAVMTFTKKGCIPVGKHIQGNFRGTSFSSSVGVFNITKGIKDPKVFTPPKSCKKVHEDELFLDEDYPIMEYFSEKFEE